MDPDIAEKQAQLAREQQERDRQRDEELRGEAGDLTVLLRELLDRVDLHLLLSLGAAPQIPPCNFAGCGKPAQGLRPEAGEYHPVCHRHRRGPWQLRRLKQTEAAGS